MMSLLRNVIQGQRCFFLNINQRWGTSLTSNSSSFIWKKEREAEHQPTRASSGGGRLVGTNPRSECQSPGLAQPCQVRVSPLATDLRQSKYRQSLFTLLTMSTTRINKIAVCTKGCKSMHGEWAWDMVRVLYLKLKHRFDPKHKSRPPLYGY